MHHGNKGPDDSATMVRVADAAGDHPLLKDLIDGEFKVTSWLYKTEPLAPGATVLLMGRVGERQPHEPVAWTYVNPYGGRVFYTSLGHEDDFADRRFIELCKRAMVWASGLPHAIEIPRPAAPPKP